MRAEKAQEAIGRCRHLSASRRVVGRRRGPLKREMRHQHLLAAPGAGCRLAAHLIRRLADTLAARTGEINHRGSGAWLWSLSPAPSYTKVGRDAKPFICDLLSCF